ncbi:MAG: ABC transporter ATP-binding protein [Candidatus Eisenbacteria bacterium]
MVRKNGLRRPLAVLLPHLSSLSPYLARHRREIALGFGCILLTNAFALSMPIVLRVAVQHLQAGEKGMWRYALLFLSLSAGSGIFLYFMRSILIGSSRHMEYEIRSDLFDRLQVFSLSFFQGQRTGDLMARATNDLNAVRDVLGPGMMYMMNTVVTVTGSVAVMLRLDPWLTLFSLAPFPLLAFLVRYFASEMHRRSRAVQDQYGSLSSNIQENLAGIRVIQSYGQEGFEEAAFDEQNAVYRDLGFRLIRYRALFFATIGSLVGLLTLILLWAGGIRVIRGAIDFGDFVAFMGYLGILTWPMIALGWVLSMVQRGEAAMARILEIHTLVPEIRDPRSPRREPPVTGAIRFASVRFRYSPQSPEVLHGIDEEIRPGTTIAIVGRTGSGKTTLVSLIPRVYDPTAGGVLLDGVDVRERPLEQVRGAVAVVPQESFLFSDTLRGNLLFGNPLASEEQIRSMVSLAGLDRDLADFPHGLDTRVGERGITLSGGQRQRVALARALLADPRILILDDALSAVDKITEAALLEALRSVRKGRTTILIAHRISTVRDADRILVLQQGRVVEAGRHAELLALGGIYAAMERRQRIEEEIEGVPAA